MALLSRRFLERRPRPHILIAGAGFAGLSAARALDPARVRVTVIDRQPLADWLPNVHELLSRRKTAEQLQVDRRRLLNAQGHDFLCADIVGIDRLQQRLLTAGGEWRDYDALILATGSRSHDYGIPGVSTHTLSPRSVESGTRVGNALTRLAALPTGRDVVIVGAGILGLEMLGEILRRFGDGQRFRLHLVEQATQLFPRFPGLHERLLAAMQGQVELHMGRRVTAVSAHSVTLDNGDVLDSRLTIWSTGRRSEPLPAEADLARPGADVGVHATLQSLVDAQILVAGDTAALPEPLEKQAFYAQDMGQHAALNALRLLRGKPLQAFRPLHKPSLLSFGDRDGLMFYGMQALASPSLIALKEAVYQYGFHLWQPPQSGSELMKMARDIRHGMRELDAWRLLLKSADTRLFHAH